MRVEIQGQHFLLHPGRAAFWVEENALICSDLHWGRENYLQKFGMAVPSFSFTKESVLLLEMLSELKAEKLWILGDFIHHPDGLDADFIETLAQWLHTLKSKLGVSVHFIPGNHDRKYQEWTKALPLQIHPHGIQKGDFQFLHEPVNPIESSSLYHWYGHLHPALRIEPLFGKRKIPCFWLGKAAAYLPAFSRLAGGAVFESRVGDRVFGIAENQVFEWPQAQ